MATVGVTDADFFRYYNVIPNLECAKLCTYYHNMHDIAVLTPHLEPARYTKFFIQKDYNDGIFPQAYFAPNCSYGGRAFNPDHYRPFDPPIEKTIPNMHLYDKYISYFSNVPSHMRVIKRILNCAHIRLSTDESTPKSFDQLMRILHNGRYSGLIFHDYDLARVSQAYDIIEAVSNTRHYKERAEIRPYPVGNKFPIQINSSNGLLKWLKILALPGVFYLQYNGIMDDQTLYALCEENERIARQTYYNITASCSGENDFLMNDLPKIFTQCLFLRRKHIKILLNYDEEIIVTPELKTILDLLNCWLSWAWDHENVRTQSLASFCRYDAKKHYNSWALLKSVTVNIDDVRDAFQWVREHNYELFKLFYELITVHYAGGKFQYDWTGD